MNDLISFLISGEAVLVYLIALVVSVIYVGFSFMKKTRQDRIKKQNTMELNKLVEEVEVQPKVQNKIPLFIIQDDQNEMSNSLAMAELEKKSNIELPVVEESKTENLVTDHILDKDAYNVVIKDDLTDKNIMKEGSMDVPSISVDEANYSSNVQNVDLSTQSEVLQEKSEMVPEISYTSIEPAQEDAKQQLAEVTEKLEKEENIELTEFEKMQEDTAIISLDELMKKAGELYGKNEEIQYQDEGNEPISLADLEKRKQEVLSLNKEDDRKEDVIEQLELKDSTESDVSSIENITPTTEKKFKSSPVISPVYGFESNPKEIYKNTELELENTANFEKLDAEIRKTNQFIATLKELQKKLD